MPVTILGYLLVILTTAFIAAVILKSFKQPPIIGYLLAGFLLSFFITQDTAHETIKLLADLGVVLLLFSLGIEFSFERFRKVGGTVFLGAAVQIIFTIWLGIILLSWLGFALFPAIFISAAFSLSSTAIVVKLLTDRGEIDTLPGEVLVGWLVIQDLAVLPMMILLPLLGRQIATGSPLTELVVSLLVQSLLAFGLLSIVLYFGKALIPQMLKKVASLNSRELLLVAVFVLSIASALFTQLVGLSAALGAFLAGILIAESTQQHAVFSEIRPLKDIFSLLFFASLGLLVPTGFIITHLPLILGVTLAFMCIKFFIVLFLTWYYGYHSKTSFLVGIGLIEIGEFAFILASTGLTTRIITQDAYGLILSVALVSVLIMPPLYVCAPWFYKNLRMFSKKKLPFLYVHFFAALEHKDTFETLPFKNHIVLCGYGRVGKYIGRALQMAKIPFVVVEYNQHVAALLRSQNIPVVYGDPSDIDILDYAQVDTARAIVVTIPDFHTQEQIIRNSLKLNKKIQILCRTHHEDHQQLLKSLGVQSVIQPEFEASLSIADKILRSFGHGPASIAGKFRQLKIEHGLG